VLLSGKQLDRLKQLELMILQDIHTFCVEHNIKYYLVGGTLLGAVRHKGFIPWDDDIDIGMFREDYDRFLKLCCAELPQKYYIQSYENEKQFWLPFAKVRLNGTVFDETATKHLPSHKGIYIDIFPIDNVKREASFFQTAQADIVKYLKIANYSRQGIAKELSFKTKVLCAASKVCSVSRINRHINSLMKAYNKKPTDYCVNLGSNYSYKKQTMPKDYYGEPVLLPFEGNQFFAPKQYQEVLTKIYGDYMKLPPEDKRVSLHYIERIDFGEYENE